MVANKTDVVPYESLPAHTRAAIEEVGKVLQYSPQKSKTLSNLRPTHTDLQVARNCNAELIPASNISEENISKLKMAACDKLLEAR